MTGPTLQALWKPLRLVRPSTIPVAVAVLAAACAHRPAPISAPAVVRSTVAPRSRGDTLLAALAGRSRFMVFGPAPAGARVVIRCADCGLRKKPARRLVIVDGRVLDQPPGKAPRGAFSPACIARIAVLPGEKAVRRYGSAAHDGAVLVWTTGEPGCESGGPGD